MTKYAVIFWDGKRTQLYDHDTAKIIFNECSKIAPPGKTLTIFEGGKGFLLTCKDCASNNVSVGNDLSNYDFKCNDCGQKE